MSEPRLLLAEPGGATVIAELTSARSRKIDFQLDGPATASFTLPGTHPDAALVAELELDLLVLRDDVPLFRGRLGTSQDTLSAASYDVNLSAVDYRGMLDRRILWSDSPLSFRGVDQGQIAWQVIADTQKRPGGNWGITQGAGTVTGVVRDRDYTPGQKIGADVITPLGEVINGFDWEVDANLAFNVYYPYRGRTTEVDLVYGAQISGVSRSLTSTSFATALRYTGQAGLQAVEIVDAQFPPAGRWEAQIGDPNLLLQQSVSDAAAATLAASNTVVPAYHLDLFDGWWQPGNLWLGDSAALFIDAGRLSVAGEVQRVVGLSIVYDDNGGETVSVDLGAVPPSMTGRLGDYNSRLEVLERSLTAPSGYMLDAPVGAMFSWPGGTPPQTWAWADGTAYSKAKYPELFAVIGYTFGGNGADVFNLPDCRSRMLVTAGSGAGLTSRGMGAVGGAETVGLDAAHTGPHNHVVAATTGGATGAGSNHTHAGSGSGTSGGVSVDHSHSLTTGTESTGHSHNVPGGQHGAQLVAAGSTQNIWMSTGNESTDGENFSHTHSGTSSGQSADHSHTTTVSLTTGGPSADHGHSFNTTSDAGGTLGTAHENMPPWIAIGQMIRVLPPWRPNP